MFEPKCTQRAKGRVRDWRVRLCQANHSQHGDRKVRTGRDQRGCGTGSQSDGEQAEPVVGMQKADAIYQESVGGKGRFLKVYGTEI